MREMSHGLAPECANSTIFCRVLSGNGRPLTYTPPSWLIPLWPAAEHPNIVLAPTWWSSSVAGGQQEEKRQKTKHSVTKSEGVANPLPATHPSA